MQSFLLLLTIWWTVFVHFKPCPKALIIYVQRLVHYEHLDLWGRNDNNSYFHVILFERYVLTWNGSISIWPFRCKTERVERIHKRLREGDVKKCTWKLLISIALYLYKMYTLLLSNLWPGIDSTGFKPIAIYRTEYFHLFRAFLSPVKKCI